MSEFRQAAIDLAEAGFWVFPCKAGSKEPAVRGYLDLRMTPEEVAARNWDQVLYCSEKCRRGGTS